MPARRVSNRNRHGVGCDAIRVRPALWRNTQGSYLCVNTVRAEELEGGRNCSQDTPNQRYGIPGSADRKNCRFPGCVLADRGTARIGRSAAGGCAWILIVFPHLELRVGRGRQSSFCRELNFSSPLLSLGVIPLIRKHLLFTGAELIDVLVV